MAVYKRDMIDLNLETGNIHRSWLKHSIGLNDRAADHFGVRVYRNGEPVNLVGVSVQGVFMPPQGDPISITSGNIVSGNEAEVVLPAACYNYDGQFCLAIRLVDVSNSVTDTVRIVDGMVDNTHSGGTISPLPVEPTWAEIKAAYEQAVTVVNKSVRFDTTQSLTDAQKATARANIGAVSEGTANELAMDIGAYVESIDNASYMDLGHKWLGFRRGYYSTPAQGSTSSYQSNSEYVYGLGACQPGDVLNAHVYGTSSIYAYAFLDSSLKVLDRGGTGNFNGTATAPANTAFVLVNNKISSMGSGYYAWIGSTATKDQISDLKSALINTEEEINGNLFVPVDGSEIIQGTYNNADGAVVSSNYRIRTKGILRMYKGQVISFTAGTNTKQIVLGTRSIGGSAFIDGSWMNDGAKITLNQDCDVIIVFRKGGSTSDTISPAHYDAVTKIIPKLKTELDALESEMNDQDNTLTINLEKTNNVVFSGDDTIYPTWENGTIDNTTHKVNPAIKYRAVSKMIRVFGDRIISTGVPNNVYIKCVYYNKDGTYGTEVNWTQNSTIGTLGYPYVMITACYSPEDTSVTMDLSDLATIKIQNYAYVLKQINEIKTNATSRANYVDGQLDLMNSVTLFKKVKTQTTSGITYTSTGDGTIKLNGSNTSSVYFDISDLTDLDVTAGEEYYLNYDSPSSKISFLTVYFNTGSGLVNAYDHVVGMNKIKIPSGTTAMLLRLWACANVSFSNTVYKLTLSKAKSNADLDPKSAEVRFLEAFTIGDCSIFKFKDGTTFVVDFGFAEVQHTLHRSWKRAMLDLGITHIDYATISHYHGDHIGLIIDTDTTDTDYIDISQYIDSNTTFFLPNGHAYTESELETLAWVDEMGDERVVSNYTAFMDKLTACGCKIVYPDENESYNIGGCTVQFINADQEWIMDRFAEHETFDYNEASMCCYVNIGSKRMFFGGDIGLQAMDKFKKSVLASQIFKVNHHAVGYDIVPIFLNSLMPEMDITMLGYNSAIGMLGSSATQEWCEKNNVPNIVTGINGKNLSLYVCENGWKWNTSTRRLICADEGITPNW